MGDPLVLPKGPITRSHAKRYGQPCSYIQVQITQEHHDGAFNKCCEELEGIPRLLMLLVACEVEMEESTPATVLVPISLTLLQYL